jgi:hypothetical protein
MEPFKKLLQALIFRRGKIKPSLSKDEVYNPRPFRQKLKKRGLPGELSI